MMASSILVKRSGYGKLERPWRRRLSVPWYSQIDVQAPSVRTAGDLWLAPCVAAGRQPVRVAVGVACGERVRLPETLERARGSRLTPTNGYPKKLRGENNRPEPSAFGDTSWSSTARLENRPMEQPQGSDTIPAGLPPRFPRDPAEVYIAPGVTAADCLHYVETDNREAVVHIIEARFRGRYLDHLSSDADFDCRPPENSGDAEPVRGFFTMAICCLMIEALSAFERGLEDTTHKGSRAAFLDFFSRRRELFNVQDDKAAGEFYEGVRCGILHQAESTSGWIIRRRETELHAVDAVIRVVNFKVFVAALRSTFDGYCEALRRGAASDEVVAHAYAKLRFVCAEAIGTPEDTPPVVTDEVLKGMLDGLAKDVTDAQIHWKMWKTLHEAFKEFPNVWTQSQTFWPLTLRAHLDASLLCLCRAYDRHEQALHLTALLKKIKENPQAFSNDRFKARMVAAKNPHADGLTMACEHSIDMGQLKKDIESCSRGNHRVRKLIDAYRNAILAHRSLEVALPTVQQDGKKKARNSKGLTVDDIDKLCATAHEVFNRYSVLFESVHWSNQIIGHDDFRWIFKVVQRDYDQQIADHNRLSAAAE